MPKCELRCPVVRAELKKIVREAPWLWEKRLSPDGVKIPAATSFPESIDKKLLSASDLRTIDDDADTEGDTFVPYARLREEIPGVYFEDEDYESRDRWADDRLREDDVGKAETIEESIETPEYRTQWSPGVKTRQLPLRDQFVETDVKVDAEVEAKSEAAKELKDAFSGGSGIAISDRVIRRGETDTQTEIAGSFKGKDPKVSGIDLAKETLKESGSANVQDDCEPTCPQRIPRTRRMRELEEKQRIVDYYLLTKGSNYFEDVCTCSLACIVRALRDDPFVRSIVASTAFFSLGLKLCSELDAWYLPSRVS